MQNLCPAILYYSRICSAVVAGATKMYAGATAGVFVVDTDKPRSLLLVFSSANMELTSPLHDKQFGPSEGKLTHN
jgi:hypothetical protein